MVYVPDDLVEEAASRAYFEDTIEAIAVAVEEKLLRLRPEWPVSTLVDQIRQLKPA